MIELNRWYHVAGVIDAKSSVMRILLNGIEVARRDFGKDIHGGRLPLRIGWAHREEGNQQSPFAGQIDEVRIWNVARTEEEIFATMLTPLSGKEPGLVAYWQFEGQGEKVIDVTGNGHDGKLLGDATRVASELPHPDALLTRDEMYQNYLQSLKLDLSVRREKPTELSDVLVITGRRVPESMVWTPPSAPVRIEIFDEAGQTLATLQNRNGEAVGWTVPDDAHGELRIVADL